MNLWDEIAAELDRTRTDVKRAFYMGDSEVSDAVSRRLEPRKHPPNCRCMICGGVA